MATATVELAARVAADTEYVSHIVDPLPEYTDYAGMLAADLRSGGFTIQFTYGYMPPTDIHAAIARLRDALDQLDIDVDLAMERQQLAAIDAESPAHEADSCGDCVAADERELGEFDAAAIDAESPAEGHEVVAEWTRVTA